MFGLISRLRTAPGKRDALAAMLSALEDMPGCVSYVVATEQNDVHALWITEVWESRAAHEASLQLPHVKAAIEAGRPLITSFDQRIETEPLNAT